MTDTYDPQKQYARVDFKDDRLMMASELNEAQDITAGKLSAVGAALLQDGQILSGVTCSWVSGLTFSVAAGLIALDGEVIPVTTGSVTFTTAPAALWIEVLQRQITATDDVSLVDPYTGDTVAERIKVVATPKAQDTSGAALPTGAISRKTVKVYDVDLDLCWATPSVLPAAAATVNPAQDAITAELVRAASGDFVVCGLDVSVMKGNVRDASVIAGPGVAWLSGTRVVLGGLSKILMSFETVDDYFVCLSGSGVLSALEAPEGLVLGQVHWPSENDDPWFLAADTGAGDSAARQRFWLETLEASADRKLRSVTGLKGSTFAAITNVLDDTVTSDSIVSDTAGCALNQATPAFVGLFGSGGEMLPIAAQTNFTSAVEVHETITTLAYTAEPVVLSEGAVLLPVPAGSAANIYATTLSAPWKLDNGGEYPFWNDGSHVGGFIDARPYMSGFDIRYPNAPQAMTDWMLLDGRFPPRSPGYSAAQTFTLPADRIVTALRIRVLGKPSATLDSLLVQLRPVVNGQPDRFVLAEKIFGHADITLNVDTTITLDDPVLLRGGAEYAVTVVCNSAGWVLAASADSIGSLSVVSGGETTALQGGSLALSLLVARFESTGHLAFDYEQETNLQRVSACLACPAGSTAVLERRIPSGDGYDWTAVQLGFWDPDQYDIAMYRVRMTTTDPYLSPFLAHDCLHVALDYRNTSISVPDPTLNESAASATVWIESREEPAPRLLADVMTLQDSRNLGNGWYEYRFTKTFSSPTAGPFELSVSVSSEIRSIVAAYH